MTTIKYRPEIDGLRAIAVLAVVFYHAAFSINQTILFPGGYIGVDVFFVISGYLISKIILSEIATNCFSVLNFYERRARRIIPALFFVMIVTSFFCWQYLSAEALLEYAKSVLSTSMFSANVFFYFQDSYNAEVSSLKPFLHMWSLGVEEQFYLVYPLVLLLASRYFKEFIPCLLTLTFFSSLFLADRLSHSNQSFNFYMILTRAWELIGGALVAIYEQDIKKIKSNLFVNVLPIIGLFSVFYFSLTFNDESRHPSLLTLIPVTGVMLFILFADLNTITGKLLSNKLVVGIGLISYSLYLWHLPIFALSRTGLNRELTNSESIGLIIISIIFSIITYHAVEKPIRNKEFASRKLVLQIFIASLIASFSFGAWAIYTDGFPNRFPDITELIKGAQYGQKMRKKKFKLLIKETNIKTASSPFHFIFSSQGKYTLLTVGDSHMKALTVPIVKHLQDIKFISKYVPLNKNMCLFVLDLDRVNNVDVELKLNNFIAENNRRFKLITKFPNPIVISGGRLPLQIESRRFNNQEGGIEPGKDNPSLVKVKSGNVKPASINDISDAYRQTISQLLNAGVKVILIYPIPEAGWHVPQTIIRRTKNLTPHQVKSFLTDRRISTSYDVFKKRSKSAYYVYDSIPDDPDLLRIFPEDIFCDDSRCYTHSDKIYYRDGNHLSYDGGEMLLKHIIREINKYWPDIEQ